MRFGGSCNKPKECVRTEGKGKETKGMARFQLAVLLVRASYACVRACVRSGVPSLTKQQRGGETQTPMRMNWDIAVQLSAASLFWIATPVSSGVANSDRMEVAMNIYIYIIILKGVKGRRERGGYGNTTQNKSLCWLHDGHQKSSSHAIDPCNPAGGLTQHCILACGDRCSAEKECCTPERKSTSHVPQQDSPWTWRSTNPRFCAHVMLARPSWMHLPPWFAVVSLSRQRLDAVKGGDEEKGKGRRKTKRQKGSEGDRYSRTPTTTLAFAIAHAIAPVSLDASYNM